MKLLEFMKRNKALKKATIVIPDTGIETVTFDLLLFELETKEESPITFYIACDEDFPTTVHVGKGYEKTLTLIPCAVAKKNSIIQESYEKFIEELKSFNVKFDENEHEYYFKGELEWEQK
jgi:hypothetical protein